MDFITNEIKTALNLTDEQVKGLTPAYENHIAESKKAWDGKANENAEKILDGASNPVFEVTKITRNKGEKVAEYIARAGLSHVSDLQKNLETAKKEYEIKLKEFKGDDATKQELEAYKSQLDESKKLLADYDKIKEKAEKYDPLQNEFLGMKLNVAFTNVKPTFSQDANKFEVDAKWNRFVNETKDKYNIELVDGDHVAISKDNEYKTVKLSVLVSEDKELTELVQGRQQQGTGTRVDSIAIDGVPFKVPTTATLEEKSALIEKHLKEKGINHLSTQWSKEFNSLFLKIK